MIKSVTQANALEEGNGSLLSLLVVVSSEEDHWQLYVLKGAHCREQVECLEDEADMSQTQARQE